MITPRLVQKKNIEPYNYLKKKSHLLTSWAAVLIMQDPDEDHTFYPKATPLLAHYISGTDGAAPHDRIIVKCSICKARPTQSSMYAKNDFVIKLPMFTFPLLHAISDGQPILFGQPGRAKLYSNIVYSCCSSSSRCPHTHMGQGASSL